MATINTDKLPDPARPCVDDVYSFPRDHAGNRARLVITDIVRYTTKPMDGQVTLLVIGEQRLLKSFDEFRRYLVSMTARSHGVVVHNE